MNASMLASTRTSMGRVQSGHAFFGCQQKEVEGMPNITKKTAWKQCKTPQTAHQQIDYMTACQGSFAEVLKQAQGPTTASVIHPTTLDSNKTIVANCFVQHDMRIFAACSTFTCATCADESNRIDPHSVQLINPYSSWCALLCERCRKRASIKQFG